MSYSNCQKAAKKCRHASHEARYVVIYACSKSNEYSLSYSHFLGSSTERITLYLALGKHYLNLYLHKIKKTPSPNWNCPEKAIQTARNLMLECTLFSNDPPAVLKSLSPPLVLKYHINTFSITIFLRNTFKALQEESKGT